MRDTTPEAEQMMRKMIQQKTPEERAKMGLSMIRTSQILTRRYILEQNPGISDGALRQQIFLKFYGNDFSEQEKSKILNHFAQM